MLLHSEDYPPAADALCVWLDVTIDDFIDGNRFHERFRDFTIAGTFVVL